MKTKLLTLTLISAIMVSCNQKKQQQGCDFRNWEIIAQPLNSKVIVRIVNYYDFYVELPFKAGDTITRWFDDREYNSLVEKHERLGRDMSDRKFKVISIKKHCWN